MLRKTAIVWGILSLFCLGAMTCVLGCSILSTGPEQATKIGESAIGVGKTVLQNYRADQTMVNASGNVTNPAYIFEFASGPVYYFRMRMALEGADLRFGINSSGKSMDDEIPIEVRQKAIDIMGSKELSDQQKQSLLEKLLLPFAEAAAQKWKAQSEVKPALTATTQEAEETISHEEPAPG
ncbi:MAG: hypothetical protein ABFE01_04195 [Phycisphaerales bacterium]